MYNFREVPIPLDLQSRRKDKRGYPIPYIVCRDKKGKYHFTVNDARMVKRVLLHNRCGLCGGKMPTDKVWFIGGPAAAFHPNGAFIDPPMHYECARYALQVCPWIAFARYTKPMSDYSIQSIEPREGMKIVADEEASKDKPEMFVLISTPGFVNMGSFQAPRLVPTERNDPEFWKDGKQLAEDDEFIEPAIQRSLGLAEERQEQKTVPLPTSYGGPRAGVVNTILSSYGC